MSDENLNHPTKTVDSNSRSVGSIRPGPVGPFGSTAPPNNTQRTGPSVTEALNELQADHELLLKKFDVHKALTRLYILEGVDKYQYLRLESMLESRDEETVVMAEKIIHTKLSSLEKELVAEKPIILDNGEGIIRTSKEASGED